MHAHSNCVLFPLHSAETETQANSHEAEEPEALQSVLAPNKQADARSYTSVYMHACTLHTQSKSYTVCLNSSIIIIL